MSWGLYYKKFSGEIIEINSDKDLLGHCTNLVNGQRLVFIVDCPNHEGSIRIQIGKESQPFVQVINSEHARSSTNQSKQVTVEEVQVNSDSGLNIKAEYDSGVANIGVNIEEENEGEDPEPEFITHQTFDEICVNVEGLTDDEDDELQAARDKVRASWSTKEKKYRWWG